MVRGGCAITGLRYRVEDDHEDDLDHNHNDHDHEDNDADQQDDQDDNRGDHESWRGASKRIKGYITTGLRSTFDDDNDD